MNRFTFRVRSILKKGVKLLLPTFYGTWYRHSPSLKAIDMRDPKRILLLNGAHIGDIVITTSLLPVLRSAYPNAEIGFVVGRWAQMVIQDHPDVAYTHCVDHWRHNRSSAGFLQKVMQFQKTRRKALKEIRSLNYDVAISLSTVFPDFLDLSWRACIPVRIGFEGSILSFLATDLVTDPESPFPHQGVRIARTLEPLQIALENTARRKSSLSPSDSVAVGEVCKILGISEIGRTRYRIIHIGSGAPRREFPVTFWRELTEKLSAQHTLLFTGQGEREQNNIRQVIKNLPNCIDACGKLSWKGFVAAVRHADVLYGVESMAGHVAGAVGTKSVVLYGGTAGVARWRPEGTSSIVFTNHVSCAPCFQPKGCDAMMCMRGIRADDLVTLDHEDLWFPRLRGTAHDTQGQVMARIGCDSGRHAASPARTVTDW